MNLIRSARSRVKPATPAHLLRDRGRETAKAWLAAHFDKIGRESSVDIHARFL